MRRQGSDALPPPTARPLGGLPGPVWGVQGRALSRPRLLALWAGCRAPYLAWGCGGGGRASPGGLPWGVPGALPARTARPLGGLPGPVWGARGWTPSHRRLLALWAGCRGRCGASGVGRSPTPYCPPSGRAAGAGVGRPGSDALPSPTARPLGGLPGPVWGVRGRALSQPRLLALWAGCRDRCGASGVGRSPTPDCSPSGRAAGAGVGRPGSDALPPPTAPPLGGLPGPVWGVRGRSLSHPRLPALWAGYRGRCGASGVGRSPTPDCSPSGRAAGAGVGRPGSDALPPPPARPLGGLPGPVWGARGRALSHPRLLALWAGCRGRCWASGVGRSPTSDCPPSVRAAGAGVGRPGSGALPPPTARPLGGLPGPVWGVRGQTLSHPRLPALWAGCRGRSGASGVGRSPDPDCPPSGRAAGAGVGRPGSDTLPTPTARTLGGLPGPVWGVQGRALTHPRLLALWAGCRGRCGASGVGRSPTPYCPPSGRAAGTGVGRPGSGALPAPTARPLGGLPGPVWGVRGPTLSHHRLPAVWAGCRGRCGASGVGRSPTPDCPPSWRAAGAGVGRPESDALPLPTARPLGGLPGCCACACPAWPGRAGRPPGRVLVRLTFPFAFLASLLACSAPSGLGLPCLWLLLGFFASCPSPPPCFFFSPPPPLCAPLSPALRVFRPGVPWALASCCPPPPFFCFLFLALPPPCCLRCFLLSGCLWPLRPPPPLFAFFFLSCCFASCCVSALCVLGCRAVCSLSCPFVVLCASSVLFLVAGVVGSWCCCLLLGVCWWPWLPGVVVWWCVLALVPASGLAVAGRPPCGVSFPCAVSCGAVLPCGAVLWCPVFFFFFFFGCPSAGGAGFLLFPGGSGLRAGSGSFLFLCSACAVLCWCACAAALCLVLSCLRGAGWCFVLLPVVFVCLLLGLAVLCCLLVGPGGSWCRVSVACCGVSLGAVLRRVAARCAAWRCVVALCVVSFCSVWCCRAPCCVLGRCPLSWRPVPSGAVFCLVPPRCVCFAVVCRCVVLFAVVLCAVCALGCRVVRFLSSPPCAVLLCGPLSLGALLPCAVPRGAVLPRGAVVSCPAALPGLFLAWVWLYLREKPLQNFVKYFFL